MNEEESDVSNMLTLEEPRTRHGKIVRKPTIYPCVNAAVNIIVYDHVSNMKEMILMNVDSESPTCSPNMHLVHETGLIGAGFGGGFDNTSELRTMKHKKSINGPDKEKWVKSIDEEWKRMVKNNAFKAIKCKYMPKDEKIITNT